MRRSAAHGLAALCLLLSGLAAYAVADLLLPQEGTRAIRYDQQSFRASRLIARSGFVLHSLVYRTSGGGVEASWFDSALSLIHPKTGIYVALDVDGKARVSTLIGSDQGEAEKNSASLAWAGDLRPGNHRFEVVVAADTTGADIPYVRAGRIGVDNLVVTQDPGLG